MRAKLLIKKINSKFTLLKYVKSEGKYKLTKVKNTIPVINSITGI